MALLHRFTPHHQSVPARAWRGLAAAMMCWALMAVSMGVARAGAPELDQARGELRQAEEDLRAQGEYPPHARWELADLAERSGAQAQMEWVRGVCEVRIDPRGIAKLWGASDPLRLRFVLYHELAHCERYASHALSWRAAGYAGSAPDALLDELVAMDMVGEMDGRVNFYALAHEAYADARAVGWLMAQGTPARELEFIPSRREQSLLDEAHSVAGASAWMLREPWRAMSLAPREAARRATARLMLDFNPYGAHRPFSQLAMLPTELIEGMVSDAASDAVWALRRPGSMQGLPGLGSGALGSPLAMRDLILAPWVLAQARPGPVEAMSAPPDRALARGRLRSGLSLIETSR